MSNYYGLFIDENDSERIKSLSGKSDIQKLWKGIEQISEWVKSISYDEPKNNEEYEKAILSVERFESWTKNSGYKIGDRIPERILNELFYDAYKYARNNMKE